MSPTYESGALLDDPAPATRQSPVLLEPSPQGSSLNPRACGWIRVLALPLLAAAAASADSVRPIPARAARAPEIGLPEKTVTLPIVMVRAFPFVEASVAGVSGKLMLDIGDEDAFSINDHRVPFTGGRTIGKRLFGSGQTFAIRLATELRGIRIGGLSYPRATNVTTQDARLLEGITPDFIGWLAITLSPATP